MSLLFPVPGRAASGGFGEASANLVQVPWAARTSFLTPTTRLKTMARLPPSTLKRLVVGLPLERGRRLPGTTAREGRAGRGGGSLPIPISSPREGTEPPG